MLMRRKVTKVTHDLGRLSESSLSKDLLHLYLSSR
jgi:hypothetical protein